MRTSERSVPRKSTLHCPQCGYESPAEAGWLRYSLPEKTEVRCPNCTETISARPRDGPVSGWDIYRDQVNAGLVTLQSGLAMWNESVKRLTSK